MSSDVLDYAPPTPRSPWKRRLIVAALFAAGASVAVAFTLVCVYFLDPNLLPHRP